MAVRKRVPPSATHILVDVRDGTQLRVAFNIESFSVSQPNDVPAWLRLRDGVPQRSNISISGEVFSIETRALPDKPKPKRKRK